MSNLADQSAVRVRRALSELSDWGLKRRIQWLRWLDHLIASRKDQILATVAADKKVSEHQVLLNEYAVVRLLCRYYIKNAHWILRDEDRSGLLSFWNWINKNKRFVVKKEPFGVVGIISPGNYPFSLSIGNVIPAVLAGNAVVLKPAPEREETNKLVNDLMVMSLELFKVEKIFEILPSGDQLGQDLVRSWGIDKIHFTGSVKTGRWIFEENMKVRYVRPTLELGGSNPAIVLEDADIEETARVILWARFCGMSCNNIKRVFAVEVVYDKLVQTLEAGLKNLAAHEVEPILEREYGNYTLFIRDYLECLDRPAEGDWYDFKPKILKVDEPCGGLFVLQEETFVPLLPVVKVRDEAEAINRANNSKFGLGASVFTKDKKRFLRIASQLDCGGVFYNDAMTEFAQTQLPFGGRKQSGLGYVHGPEGLLEFVRLKTIIMDRWRAPKLHLYPWTPGKMKWLRRLIDWIIKLS